MVVQAERMEWNNSLIGNQEVGSKAYLGTMSFTLL